jgi:putative membrane protein
MPTETDDAGLLTLVLVIVGALIVLPALFMGSGMMGTGPMMDGNHGMWGWGDGPQGWMLLFGLLMQIVFLAAIVGGGYLVYRTITGTDSGTDPALEELRVAYARGDLSDEEFERRREALEENR